MLLLKCIITRFTHTNFPGGNTDAGWECWLCVQEKLRFQVIRHVITNIDCQPTAESGVVMLVTGQLKVLYRW